MNTTMWSLLHLLVVLVSRLPWSERCESLTKSSLLIERYRSSLAPEPFLEGRTEWRVATGVVGVHMERPKPHRRVISKGLRAVRVPAVRNFPLVACQSREMQASVVRYHANGPQRQGDGRNPCATHLALNR